MMASSQANNMLIDLPVAIVLISDGILYFLRVIDEYLLY
jgi:hypothetical protein